MGSMVGTGRSARLITARDKLDIDRFGSKCEELNVSKSSPPCSVERT